MAEFVCPKDKVVLFVEQEGFSDSWRDLPWILKCPCCRFNPAIWPVGDLTQAAIDQEYARISNPKDRHKLRLNHG